MTFDIIVLFFIFTLTTLLFYIEITRLKLSRKFKHIPSVKPCPILGTTQLFTFYDMTQFKRYVQELGFAPVTKIFLGPMMVFLASDPDVMYEISHSPAFLERPFFMRFFPWPKGMLSCECK